MFTDLVPLRAMLVEQCQPLQNQRQQHGSEEVHYALQEHDYESHGEEHSQMAFILVKQEVSAYMAANPYIFPFMSF